MYGVQRIDFGDKKYDKSLLSHRILGAVIGLKFIKAYFVDIKEIYINNATYIFALVKNTDWITIDFPNEKDTLTRHQIQQWYGKDISKITTEKDLKKLIQTNVNNETKVNELFKK
ncbi:MAG: hypothetical protein Q8935_12225 [Bacillota bacterium]|nr:hypothetical protein [Bacillota bacterium]